LYEITYAVEKAYFNLTVVLAAVVYRS